MILKTREGQKMVKNTRCRKAKLAIAALLVAGALYPMTALAANKLIVKDTGSVDKFVVTETGAIGVGTNAPLSAIHVSGTMQTFSQIKASASQAGAGANGGGGVLMTHNNGSALPLNGDRLGYMNVGAVDDLVPTTNRFGGGFVFNAGGDWSIDRVNNIVHFPTSLSLRTADTSGVAQTRVTISPNGNVGIGSTAPTSQLQVVGLPVHANNQAASGAGLTAGAFYRTGGDPDLVCVVH
jgi:hypothetical protein